TVQIVRLTVAPDGRWHPRICSMAVVWTFNVPDAGTRRVFSIEDRIWDGHRTSALGTSWGVSRQIRARGGGLGDDLQAAPLERYFWGRNAPYSLNDPGNPLISQQMRPPSERTINQRYLYRHRTPSSERGGSDGHCALRGEWTKWP